MDSIKKNLEGWLNELNRFSFKSYDNLPDIDLYMDQVMNMLEKQLYIFQNTSIDKQITPSMINNYVKGEVVPAPVAKKYSKEHLAIIEEVYTLKQVLSIAEVKQIIDTTYATTDKALVFDNFNNLNTDQTSKVVSDTFKALNDVDDNDTHALTNIALEYTTIANSYINIAKKILFLIKAYEFQEEAKAKALERQAKKEKQENPEDIAYDNEEN